MLRRNVLENASLIDDCIYFKGVHWDYNQILPYNTLVITLQKLNASTYDDVYVDWGDNSLISNDWSIEGRRIIIKHNYNTRSSSDDRYDIRIFGNRSHIALNTAQLSGSKYPLVGYDAGTGTPGSKINFDEIYIPKYAIDNAQTSSDSTEILEKISIPHARQLFLPEEADEPVSVENNDIPRCSEPFLCRLYGTKTKQIETNGLIFDGTEALNGIGPKLYGQTLNALGANNSVSHTYTTHPDKTVKEVICNFDNVEAQYQLSDLTYLSFDPETFTITASSSSATNHVINRDIAIKIVYEDGTFDVDRFNVRCNYYEPCLVYGTQISVYGGKTKSIEDISYDDLLLVYNFLTGEMEYQHPFFIKKESMATKYVKLELDNGKTLKLVGYHEVYDNKNKAMITISDKNYNNININDVLLLGEDGNNVKINNISLVVEDVKFSTVLTSGTICYYASGVLNGAETQNLLGFTNENKYHTVDLYNMIRSTNSEYTYNEFVKEFGVLPKYIFYGNFYDVGLRAIMAYNYASERPWKTEIKQSINGFWAQGKPPEFSMNSKIVHPITFIDKDSVETKKFEEGEIITIPNCNSKWLCVVDNKEYSSGQNYEVNVGTVFRRVYE